MLSDSRRFCATLYALVGTVGFLFGATAQAGAQPAAKVKVFMYAQKGGSEFVDPRTQDLELSVKDIREAIAKRKNTSLQLVEAQDQADIVLEVTERKLVERQAAQSTTTTTYAKDGKSASSTTTQTKEHDVVLKAVMHVGDYTNELTGQCDLGYLFGGPYRQAAKDLVGSLEAWVKTNYTRLQQKKAQLTPGAAL